MLLRLQNLVLRAIKQPMGVDLEGRGLATSMRSAGWSAPEIQSERIPVLHPRLPATERLLPYLHRIDATRRYSNHGPLVLEFERRLAEHLQLPAGGLMSASSGTAALIGTIIASAGRATPERPLAFMPSFTFVGTASAAEICGYQPYLADIDANTWMLDASRLACHPERDRIGVIVPVAPFGRGVPQAPWASLRQETGIPVVIDGAASFEAAADAPHRFLGPIPVALSFHATKSFATAEGGGIATTDLDLAKRAAQVLNFGCWGSRNSALPSINGKMSEYHAAVGLAELDGWASKSAALRAVADAYRRCSDQMGLFNRLITTPLIAGCYVLFRCFGMEETTRVKESLGRKGIDFRLWYGHGLHHQTYFTGVAHESLDATEELAPNLLGLPLAPDLSEAAITRVVSSLADGVNGQRS